MMCKLYLLTCIYLLNIWYKMLNLHRTFQSYHSLDIQCSLVIQHKCLDHTLCSHQQQHFLDRWNICPVDTGCSQFESLHQLQRSTWQLNNFDMQHLLKVELMVPHLLHIFLSGKTCSSWHSSLYSNCNHRRTFLEHIHRIRIGHRYLRILLHNLCKYDLLTCIHLLNIWYKMLNLHRTFQSYHSLDIQCSLVIQHKCLDHTLCSHQQQHFLDRWNICPVDTGCSQFESLHQLQRSTWQLNNFDMQHLLKVELMVPHLLHIFLSGKTCSSWHSSLYSNCNHRRTFLEHIHRIRIGHRYLHILLHNLCKYDLSSCIFLHRMLCKIDHRLIFYHCYIQHMLFVLF